MALRGESPKEAAQRIETLMPPGITNVYEIGSRRILGVTCYLSREVVTLDDFSHLSTYLPIHGPMR